ncbi:hypothetical protein BCR37DRAFT_397019 [Protomyces lactucae-debilis]|uniref:Uncharacterized protein n=1 Tax=Protomyces lactucae-debilis TaxID=2754530 RepID=A0A1Y2FT81_PROLT|nr:uncharacterized protein BCR37DRAFT_397019 [Protomyces lactucae-debilis]ORY86396.1 hypothetical protein BCR37DRAFT_397019 [Protomyces lactucae-debilis]
MIILESSPILDMRKSMRLSGGLPYEQQRHHFSNARRPLSPSRVLGFLSGLPKCVRMPIKYQDLVETLVLLNVRRVGQPRCSIQWFAGEETENPYGVHAVDPMSPRNIAILEERPLARPQHFSPRQQEGLSNQHLHRSHAHQLEDGLHSARTMPGLMEDKDSPDMTLSRSLTYPATRHQSKSTAADTDSDIVIVDAMEALTHA